MKTAEAIFMLHGDITRKSKLLELIDDDVYIVAWPDISVEDVVKNLSGFDPNKHKVLNIGSREKLFVGRNNIIDWCKQNNIHRFWMLDDDIMNFRIGGPSQEFKDKILHNGKVRLKNLEFDDDTGLGGLTMSGVMFNHAVNAPMFSNRFIWAAVFLDLDVNHTYYSIEGYDDIDMQMECVKNGVKAQTHNWVGHAKPNWLSKKSTNSPISKINYYNFLIYRKWGDSVVIDVYYDKQHNKYFRIHVRYPYKIRNTFRYSIDSLDSFVESLENDYKQHPENFKVCGLPHMKSENKNHSKNKTKDSI